MNIDSQRRQRKIALIEVMGGVCHDCGASFPDYPEVFQFDHIYGKEGRDDRIGTLLRSATWERLITAAEKCELVCANCHQIRTAQRRQWGVILRE